MYDKVILEIGEMLIFVSNDYKNKKAIKNA